MKFGGIYSVLLLAGVFCLASTSYSAEISSGQIQKIEKQAQTSQLKHKQLQAQAAQLNLDLNKLNKQLIASARQIQQGEAAVTKSEEELKLLENKLAVSVEEFNAEYKKLESMLGALQNLALHPTQSMLVMPLTPVEVVRSAVLMRESVPYLNDNAEKLKQNLERLEKQKKEIEDKLSKLKKQKKQLLKQQDNLKKLSSQKASLRQKVEGESKKYKEEALRLSAEASDLRDLLEKALKEQDLRKRKQEEIRRAAKAREEAQRRLEKEQKRRINQGYSSGLKDENGNDFYQDDDRNLVYIQPRKTAVGEVNFETVRGKLTLPVSGQVLTSYGQELSKGVSSKGLVFKTRSGAQVVAPYDGTVIFSGPFKGYGNLIIVEHGQGYVSLLAGMKTVDAENGQILLAGEPVGVMPDSDPAKLYVEIRKNRRPVNPVPWFGI